MRDLIASVISIVTICSAAQSTSADLVVDFEELTQFTANSPDGGGQFYNGNDGSNTTNDDGWTSGAVFFNNSYNGQFDFWSGWSYSNVVNSTSQGFSNQYASTTGGGADGLGGVSPGSNYAMAFGDGAFFNLPTNTAISSVELTNSTYAALSMLNGDAFAKKFGGATGDDPDFFRVILTGFDELDGFGGTGNAIGSVTVDLADYTFTDNTQDYILQEWLTVDLSTLSDARSVAIKFESSDVGPFGINTPTYVALDNLTMITIPEPSCLALLWLGVTGLLQRRNRDAN